MSRPGRPPGAKRDNRRRERARAPFSFPLLLPLCWRTDNPDENYRRVSSLLRSSGKTKPSRRIPPGSFRARTTSSAACRAEELVDGSKLHREATAIQTPRGGERLRPFGKKA